MGKHFCILEIRDGEVQNKTPIDKLIKELRDGKYLLEANKHNKRSTPQNRYYFGVCVQLVQHGLKDMGMEVSQTETHEFLKSKFNYSELINEGTGQMEMVPKSTSGLNKEQFAEYISKIQIWAAEFLGIVIPDPGEVLKLEL